MRHVDSAPASPAVAAAANPPTSPMAAVWIAALGHFLNDIYGNIYPVLVPLLMTPLAMSVTAAAWVTSLNGLVTAILQPIWGNLADRRGGLRFLPYALLAGAAAVAAMGFSPNYAVLMLLVFIAASGNSAFHPPAAALVHRSGASTRRGMHMSVFMVAGNLGRALGPTLAGIAALWAGAKSVGLVALPGILVALVIAGALRRMSDTAAGHGGDHHGGHGGGHAHSVPPGLGKALRHYWPAALLLLLMSASRSVVTSAVITYLPLRYHLAGGPVMQGALFIGVMLAVGAIGNAMGGSLSDRVPRLAVVGVASILSGLFMTLFVGAHGLWALFFLALTGFTAMSVSSVVIVLGQEMFPQHVATAAGLVLGWGNAAASLGVGLLAFLARTHGIDVALYVSAGLSALGLPLALLFPLVRRRLA